MRGWLENVLRGEEEMGVPFPWDLRRLLLEIGDVVNMFFGVPCTKMHPDSAKEWKWTPDALVRLDEDDTTEGSIYLGGCPRLSDTEIMIVTTGDQRGRVWVFDSSGPSGLMKVTPLATSDWKSASTASYSGSDIIRVFCSSVCMPRTFSIV